jgi:hypothetical protein
VSDVPRLHDVVRLATDLPDEGLVAGSLGTVVDVFDTPRVAYEVEFADADGRTIAELALLPAQIERVASF